MYKFERTHSVNTRTLERASNMYTLDGDIGINFFFPLNYTLQLVTQAAYNSFIFPSLASCTRRQQASRET